ncbi:hypothetical protein [Streptomyces sp. NPDC097981]|uniref:hypothetical protein n=1 Tax=Streptomyces sp. NPDC097981 TaxID=3155428 RepID=UPI0033263D1A
MKFKLGRRGAMAATVAVLTAGGLGLGAAGASASQWTWLSTSHGVGVYSGPGAGSGKVGAPDLFRGDAVHTLCWTRGDNLGNGNVWYKVDMEYYRSSGWMPGYQGWTYGGYVDSNAEFHNGLPECR